MKESKMKLLKEKPLEEQGLEVEETKVKESKIKAQKVRASFFNNMKLRGKLVVMSLLPLFLLGTITIVIFSNAYIESSVAQSEEDLYGVASTILSAYEQNTGVYFYASNDNLWKGAYNISLSIAMLEHIKERTGNDITIIRFDDPEKEIVITTAKNIETNEVYEYIMNESLKKKVSEGKEIFSDGLKVNKVQHYFYAIPMIQDQTDDEVIGAVIASVDKSKRINVAYNTIKTLVMVAVWVIIGSIMFTIFISNNITSGLKKGFKVLGFLAQGKLDIDTSGLDLRRKDEMGDMFKNINHLKESLRDIIKGNIQLSNNIGENVEDLNKTAHAAKSSVGYIDEAIATVNQVAKKQGNISKRVTKDIDTLGKMIQNTYANIHELNNSNIELQNVNTKASKVVEELSLIKETLNNIIEITSKQTKDTYELTKDIKQYAGMITDFAEETNLLALNASIEAARVGEKGKGFAIVATQIQALADQSNIVSNDITQAINMLVDDSKRSVETMDKVHNVIDNLNVNIEGTKDIFQVVNISVDFSLNGLKQIEKQAEVIDETRGSITAGIHELDDVIQKNKKSMANTEEVRDHIGELFEKSNFIKGSTEKLLDSISQFEL